MTVWVRDGVLLEGAEDGRLRARKRIFPRLRQTHFDTLSNPREDPFMSRPSRVSCIRLHVYESFSFHSFSISSEVTT
jgi:hypothetical protein